LNPTIEELSASVEQEAKQRPEVLCLMTHPGVGPITALAFVLIIDSTERFACGKQIASYVGLIPCEDSSADRRRLGHITKQGNTLLRFLLVEAAQAAVRHDPDWRRRYTHLAMRRERRIAKVAMARKLAVGLYWMMQGMELRAIEKVRFVRGRVQIRPWCAVNHRPLGEAGEVCSRKLLTHPTLLEMSV
jgi:transposase